MLKVKAKYDEQLQTAIDSYIKAVQAIRSEYKESIAAEKVKEHNQKLRDKATEIRKAYEADLDALHGKTKKDLESKEAERQLRLKQASTDERILMQLERLEVLNVLSDISPNEILNPATENLILDLIERHSDSDAILQLIKAKSDRLESTNISLALAEVAKKSISEQLQRLDRDVRVEKSTLLASDRIENIILQYDSPYFKTDAF